MLALDGMMNFVLSLATILSPGFCFGRKREDPRNNNNNNNNWEKKSGKIMNSD